MEIVDERLTQCQAAERAVEAGLARAKRLRQAILKRAFEGKLVPQDPNDEPASELLAQISAPTRWRTPKAPRPKASKQEAAVATIGLGSHERDSIKMKMVEHTVELLGESVEDGRPRPEAVGEVLRLVEPTVRMSVSMGFRNTSRKLGRPPEWFRRATDIRFVGMSGSERGGTLLHFEAPRFREAAEEVYGQGELFRVPPAETDTGFDLLGDAVSDVRENRDDSFRYDMQFLNRMHKLYGAASRKGVEAIALLGDRLPTDHPISIDGAVSEHAERMRQIPPDQRACRRQTGHDPGQRQRFRDSAGFGYHRPWYLDVRRHGTPSLDVQP